MSNDGESHPVLVSPRHPHLNYVRVPDSLVALEVILSIYAVLMTATAVPLAFVFLIVRRRSKAKWKYPYPLILSTPGPGIMLGMSALAGFFLIRSPDQLATIIRDSRALFIDMLGFAVFTVTGAFISIAAVDVNSVAAGRT